MSYIELFTLVFNELPLMHGPKAKHCLSQTMPPEERQECVERVALISSEPYSRLFEEVCRGARNCAFGQMDEEVLYGVYQEKAVFLYFLHLKASPKGMRSNAICDSLVMN